ncbi:nitrilase-related carbon-nitrogen hydrolase [Methanothrix sp.]|uniref:nitrilase-related carbon-nitrogen hydrolase n=1 Tax=Methanothrix sp. TaxID=90426 RepID=UPI003C71003F
MRAACVQLSVRECDACDNKRRALQLSADAADSGADIIVLPELFLTGFCYDLKPEREPYPSLISFRALSLDSGAILAGSIMASSERGLLNMGFCIAGAEMGFYSKTHPFGEEKKHFVPGDRIAPVRIADLSIGLEICYDIRFPEVARKLCASGADILITVAQFPAERIHHWRALVIARAIENQIHHIACNASGSAGGSSMIVGPAGEVLAEAGGEECVVIADLDLDERDQVRRSVTCWEDRRPELY